MNCMSKKVQRAKAKLDAERYEEEIKKCTPEEQAEIDRRGREAMQFLTAAMSINAIAGDSYTNLVFNDKG